MNRQIPGPEDSDKVCIDEYAKIAFLECYFCHKQIRVFSYIEVPVIHKNPWGSERRIDVNAHNRCFNKFVRENANKRRPDNEKEERIHA